MSFLSGYLKNILELIKADKRAKVAALGVLLLLIAIPAFLYTQKPKATLPSASSQVLGNNTISLDQVNDIMAKVSKLADLPIGETPNIATVNDATKLRDQPFFAKAENGDKVLIFQNAHTAILYRPGTNKIIEYSTITVAVETPTPTPGAE